jgi:hypothetical protein
VDFRAGDGDGCAGDCEDSHLLPTRADTLFKNIIIGFENDLETTYTHVKEKLFEKTYPLPADSLPPVISAATKKNHKGKYAGEIINTYLAHTSCRSLQFELPRL